MQPRAETSLKITKKKSYVLKIMLSIIGIHTIFSDRLQRPLQNIIVDNDVEETDAV